MAKIDFDCYSDIYNNITGDNVRFFSEDDLYFAKIKINIIHDIICYSPKRILEFGAGVGRNIPFIKEYFPDTEIWATDISEKSAAKINERYPYVKTFILNGDELRMMGMYDLVLVSGVYHHISPNIRSSVTKTIVSLMTENADLFVFEHNPYNLITRKLVDRCEYDKDAVLVNPKEMSTLLSEAGLNLIRKRFYLYFPPALKMGWLERILYKVPLGGQYMLQASKSNDFMC